MYGHRCFKALEIVVALRLKLGEHECVLSFPLFPVYACVYACVCACLWMYVWLCLWMCVGVSVCVPARSSRLPFPIDGHTTYKNREMLAVYESMLGYTAAVTR